jgi:hypothetical protein
VCASRPTQKAAPHAIVSQASDVFGSERMKVFHNVAMVALHNDTPMVVASLTVQRARRCRPAPPHGPYSARPYPRHEADR